MAEFMRLGKVGVIGTADILNEFGAKNLSPYVRVASNSLDAAEKTVALWAPIYDDVKAIRSDAQ